MNQYKARSQTIQTGKKIYGSESSKQIKFQINKQQIQGNKTKKQNSPDNNLKKERSVTSSSFHKKTHHKDSCKHSQNYNSGKSQFSSKQQQYQSQNEKIQEEQYDHSLQSHSQKQSESYIKVPQLVQDQQDTLQTFSKQQQQFQNKNSKNSQYNLQAQTQESSKSIPTIKKVQISKNTRQDSLKSIQQTKNLIQQQQQQQQQIQENNEQELQQQQMSNFNIQMQDLIKSQKKQQFSNQENMQQQTQYIQSLLNDIHQLQQSIIKLEYEKRNLEAISSKTKLQLDSEIQQQQKSKKDYDFQIEKYQKQVQKLEETILTLKAKYQQSDFDLQEIRNQLDIERKQKDKLLKQQQKQYKVNEQMENETQKYQNEGKQFASEIENYKMEIQEKDNKIQYLKNQYNELMESQRVFKEENDSLRANAVDNDKKIYQINSSNQDLVYQLERQLKEKNSQIQIHLEKQKLLNNEIEDQKDEIRTLKSLNGKEKELKEKFQLDFKVVQAKLGEVNDLEKRIVKKNKYIEELEIEIDKMKARIRKDPNLLFDNENNDDKLRIMQENLNNNNRVQVSEKIIEKPVFVDKVVEVKVRDREKEFVLECQIVEQRKDLQKQEEIIQQQGLELGELKQMMHNRQEMQIQQNNIKDEEMAQYKQQTFLEIDKRDIIIQDLKKAQQQLMGEIEYLTAQNLQRNKDIRQYIQEEKTHREQNLQQSQQHQQQNQFQQSGYKVRTNYGRSYTKL